MTRKFACILALLCALPLAAQAQQPPRPPGAPPPGPKPTKADVQKVVQIISADKVRLGNYCKLAAIDEQMAKAAESKDNKKLEDLGKQGEALQQTLGPEYIKLTSSLEQVDPQSKEGQDLIKEFEPLDKQCTAK